MDVKNVLEKVDYILLSNTFEKEYLFHKINLYYRNIKKRKCSPLLIECDFKKREIIRFWEYLDDDLTDLGKGF